MTRKRAHAQDLAQSICDLGETDVTEVETWSDDDLYDWLEAWGYSWEGADGWIDLEDIEYDYPDDDPVSVVDFFKGKSGWRFPRTD